MRIALCVSLSMILLLVTGCGEEPKPETKVTPEVYEKVWKALIVNMSKKKISEADRDKVFKKHGITQEEWTAAEIKYEGLPPSLQDSYNKAMGLKLDKVSGPPPTK